MSTQNIPLNCPVSATLQLIGGKYKALILWHLVPGVKRYGALSRLIPQATPKMLTQQLRELEEDNLIARTVYPVVPPKVEYGLTELGKKTIPILQQMHHFGVELLQEPLYREKCISVDRLTDSSDEEGAEADD